jgi:pterin-4a-carbinolamine dehydratase
MPPLVFIGYRRTDTQQAAFGLHAQLRARLGLSSVFMDRSGLRAGEVWPERLLESVNHASVVLALIGPDWLRCADNYARRRLDNPRDWVRNELATSIAAGKLIIPVLLAPVTAMLPPEALPAELEPLTEFQSYSLRDDHWDVDLNGLIALLTANYGFKEADQKVRLPHPEVKVDPIPPTELDEKLKLLTGWEPVESLIPGDYPKSRLELRKIYVFNSLRAAIQFMSSAVEPIKLLKHHPRWENQWRTVTVYLSTWDIGSRISQLDLELAQILDRLYADQAKPE